MVELGFVLFYSILGRNHKYDGNQIRGKSEMLTLDLGIYLMLTTSKIIEVKHIHTNI